MEGGREAKGELELYNDWFGKADVDRDNRLSGPEAGTWRRLMMMMMSGRGSREQGRDVEHTHDRG